MRDQRGRKVAGATVTIRDTDGVLIHTLTSDSLGAWATTLAAGDYVIVYSKGDAVITHKLHVCPE